MADLDFQNFSTVQNLSQLQPSTVASAATVTPLTFMTKVTGTVAISTITPPVTGQHMLLMLHTDATPTAYTTTGNVLTIVVPTVNVPSVFVYDPIQKKYYGWANNIT
jgi:DUF4097 and DUF4098 domain-containing protein YvlB